MTTTRLQMQKNKKENGLKVQKREIALLLQNGKDESARIKVEGLIRDEYMVEAFELVTLFCDLLSTRLQLLVESRGCPPDMKESVSTLIWAAPRIENVPELLTIREQLARKFGKEFAYAASDNAEMAVNQKVYYRLSMQVPEPYLCVQHLKDIAKQYEIEWNSDDVPLDLPISGMGAGIGSLPDGPTHKPPPGPPPPSNNSLPPPPNAGFPPAQPPYQPPPPTDFNHHNEPSAPPPPPLGGPFSDPFFAPRSDPSPTHFDGPPAPTYSGHENQAPLPPPTNDSSADVDFSDLEARFEALRRGQ